MSVIPVDFGSKPARTWLWRVLAEKLNALVAYPVKHAVSERELRRVDEDIRRCEQLVFQKHRRRRDVELVRVLAPRQPQNG
jgi:hypothetical protein